MNTIESHFLMASSAMNNKQPLLKKTKKQSDFVKKQKAFEDEYMIGQRGGHSKFRIVGYTHVLKNKQKKQKGIAKRIRRNTAILNVARAVSEGKTKLIPGGIVEQVISTIETACYR